MKVQTVYLDRRQCEEFEVQYFESCSLKVRANLLLNSKMQGYDTHHRDILQPLGDCILHLEHTDKEDMPGWFKIKNVESYRSSF